MHTTVRLFSEAHMGPLLHNVLISLTLAQVLCWAACLSLPATSEFTCIARSLRALLQILSASLKTKPQGIQPKSKSPRSVTLKTLPWLDLPSTDILMQNHRQPIPSTEDTRFVSSVQFSRSVVSDSLQPHELQHARPPCPSPTPGVHSHSRPSSQRCHPAITSSVVPFSSCPQSLPASESFPMSQLFASGGQSTGVSALASVLPKDTQD